jgi:hypothetical protein
MQAMADLFALKCIYEEALFRNDEYVSPEKAKAIARMIEELCLEVGSSPPQQCTGSRSPASHCNSWQLHLRLALLAGRLPVHLAAGSHSPVQCCNHRATVTAAGARCGGAAVRSICHPRPHSACANWPGYRARGPVWRIPGRHWLGPLQRLRCSAVAAVDYCAAVHLPARPRWHLSPSAGKVAQVPPELGCCLSDSSIHDSIIFLELFPEKTCHPGGHFALCISSVAWCSIVRTSRFRSCFR